MQRSGLSKLPSYKPVTPLMSYWDMKMNINGFGFCLAEKTSAELRVKSSKTATNTESHQTGREKKIL